MTLSNTLHLSVENLWFFIAYFFNMKEKWNDPIISLFSCLLYIYTFSHTHETQALPHIGPLPRPCCWVQICYWNQQMEGGHFYYPCGSPVTLSQSPAVSPSGNLKLLLFSKAIHMATMTFSVSNFNSCWPYILEFLLLLTIFSFIFRSTPLSASPSRSIDYE